MTSIWRNFPAIYALPFIFTTTQFSVLVSVSELARWAVLVAAFLVAFRFKFRRGGFSRILPLRTDLFLAVVLAVFFVSFIWSIDPAYTFQKSISILLLAVTSFWAFWRYADRYSEKRLLDGILNILVVVLIANITVGWFLADPMLAGRFRGFFLNPNNIGILVSLAGPLLAMRWLSQKTWANTLVFAIVMANLILAGSRTGLLAVGLVLVLSLGRTLIVRPFYGLVFIGALVVSGLWFTQTEFFAQRILREDTLADASNRVFFWALANEYIANRPLLGHGFGTDIIIHQFYNLTLGELGLRGAGVMSSYYGLAIQIGVPMTVAFFMVVWGYIVWVMLMRAHDFLRFSYAAVLAGGLIVAVFEPLLFSAGNAFSFLFWIVFMLLVRREAYQRQRVLLGQHGEIAPRQFGPHHG